LSVGHWGYADCGFSIKGDRLLFSGSRYEISDRSFDSIAFLSKVSGIPLLRNRRSHTVRLNPSVPTLPASHRVLSFLNSLFGGKAGQQQCVSTDVAVRYLHGTGHTISDMLTLRIEDRPFRIPDVVVWPSSRAQVVELVAHCVSLGAALIPYGGGTNVTHSLWCDAKERRVIVSVDMTRMNRIEWVNRETLTASVGAGMTGKAMESELAKYGFTTGHCPDSYEFSTLGGWIATFASGMKRARYGNIEDIVVDVEVVTARGLIARNVPFGRVSVGSNNLLQFYGSEGTLGIIVSAVVRLTAVPDVVEYDSAVFKCWDHGLNLMKMVRNEPQWARPASLRLVDNTQFKLSQTMKEKEATSALKKLYLAHAKGFDFDSICAATIVYEGGAKEVALQRARINALIARNGGLRGGAKSGKAGFNLTFAIAYLRDFLLENFGVLAESFETFIPWDRVDGFQQALHGDIRREHRRRGFRGTPFLSSRISQVYDEGVCLYSYYGMWAEAVDGAAYDTYSAMEDFIKTRMLELGGSLSHHHGVGQLRAHILSEHSSQQMAALTRAVKTAFDPDDIFCVKNGLLSNTETAHGAKEGDNEEEQKAFDHCAEMVTISDASDNASSAHSTNEHSSTNISTPSLVYIE